jgi:hypothetical protein
VRPKSVEVDPLAIASPRRGSGGWTTTTKRALKAPSWAPFMYQGLLHMNPTGRSKATLSDLPQLHFGRHITESRHCESRPSQPTFFSLSSRQGSRALMRAWNEGVPYTVLPLPAPCLFAWRGTMLGAGDQTEGGT